MKRLDRYVIRELLVPFFIGTFAVVLMFQANQLMADFKTYSIQHVPTIAIVQLVLLKTPFYLQLTLPVGVSLATSLAFSRLTRESELTAMRVAGARILRVVMPAAAFGLLVGVGNFFIVEKLMPQSERQFRKLSIQVGVLGAAPDFASNVTIKLKNYVAFIGTVSRARDGAAQLSDILLYDRHISGSEVLMTAPTGRFKDGIWTLQKPYVHVLKDKSLVLAESRSDMILNEKIPLQDLFMAPMPEEQNAAELRQAINGAHKLGQSTNSMEVVYHTKFSVPAACMIFAFTAPIFSIIFARHGGLAGVLLSIILVFAYYNGFVISTEILGRTGLVPPIIAAWLPNFIFAALGFFALRRLE
ncbi:MAG: LptF/LptG family permease [Armatimonadetes bacterium]|nr:LptF/LptG family permease [Armatimonadota bacterium]